MHLLDVVLVSSDARAESSLKKCEEEARVDVVVELEDVLDDLGARVEEQFDHCPILAIVVLKVHEAVEESEEELVQALDAGSEILRLDFTQFFLKK